MKVKIEEDTQVFDQNHYSIFTFNPLWLAQGKN
jgi:hypothetical protein